MVLIDWLAHVEITKALVSIATLRPGANLSDIEIKETRQIARYYKNVFDKVTMPFLDAYGEHDNPPVLASAPFKKSAVNNTHVESRQVILNGSDHFLLARKVNLLSVLLRGCNQLVLQILNKLRTIFYMISC